MFWKLDMFLSSGEGEKTPNQLGALERANLNHWTTLPFAVTGLSPYGFKFCVLYSEIL
jgi:hypothetical protein